jgi:putative addiction module component (TIGR02574 family)
MKLLSEIAKDALELSPGQRLTLARILLDLSELDQDFSPHVETAWDQEIERRMEAVKSGNAQSKSFEQVFTELDLRFPS